MKDTWVMIEKKISIIIPVYNAKNSLRRCLDSIANQDFSNFEVWMINDGSTDSSPSICDEYSSSRENFHVHHCENSGVSNARNTGIKLSSGYYLTFIDADDFVSTDYLSQLYESDIDMSICGCTIIQDNRPPILETIGQTTPYHSDSRRNIINRIINHHLVRPVWGKLFKESTISQEKIFFDSSVRLGEDTLFVLKYLYYVKTAKIAQNTSYYYIRDGFKINKFRNSPGDIIATYSKLQELTKNLESIDLKPTELYYSNYRSLCNNFFSVVFLSGKYTFGDRKKYFFSFKAINPSCFGQNFGISNTTVASIYKFVISLNIYLFIDLFLMIYYKLLKLKTR